MKKKFEKHINTCEATNTPRGSKKDCGYQKTFITAAKTTLQIASLPKNGLNALAVDAPPGLSEQRQCYSLDADNGCTHCVAISIKHLSGSISTAPSHRFLEIFNNLSRTLTKFQGLTVLVQC